MDDVASVSVGCVEPDSMSAVNFVGECGDLREVGQSEVGFVRGGGERERKSVGVEPYHGRGAFGSSVPPTERAASAEPSFERFERFERVDFPEDCSCAEREAAEV